MEKEITFFGFFKETVREHYLSGKLWFLAAFLCAMVFINFYFNVEKRFLYQPANSAWGIVWYMLFYGFAYFAILARVLRDKKNIWKSKRLWLLSLGVVFSLSVSATYFYISPIVHGLNDLTHAYVLRKLLVNVRNVLLVALPAAFFWKYLKSKGDAFFWFSFKKVKFKTYVLLLLPVVLLAFFASFSSSFLSTYPTFKPQLSTDFLGIAKSCWIWIYETVYVFDFVWVEFLFRGILVLGLFSVLGKDAIIPMVSMYCFLHFGKPLGEAISSVFGGYILGVLGMYSRSIVGGCFLHMGVALSMDIFALIKI